MFERIKHMLIKEFIQVFRDPRMRIVIFVIPCVQVLVIGYAVSTDVKHVRTAVYDLDNSQASRDLTARFVRSGYFDVVARDRERRPRPRDVLDRSDVTRRAAVQPRLCRGPRRRPHGPAANHRRRHRLEHGRIAASYAMKIATAYSEQILDGARGADAGAGGKDRHAPSCAPGRGSTRTWRAATSSCPACW